MLEYRLLVSQADFDDIREHAEACWPLEAVALLFGKVDGEDVIIRSIAFIENMEQSTTKFSVDPVKEYNLLVEAEKRDEELVCIFHSHPAPPRPSSSDLQNMRLNPVIWLIGSKITGEWEFDAYILTDGQTIKKVPICIS